MKDQVRGELDDGAPIEGTRNHRFHGKLAGTAASTLGHRESKNVTAVNLALRPTCPDSRSSRGVLRGRLAGRSCGHSFFTSDSRVPIDC